MGLFSKVDHIEIVKQFDEIMQNGTRLSEEEFLDSLNAVVKAVEVESTYSISKKLAIYEALSLLTNCSSSDRLKYAKKLRKKLL